MIQEAENRGKGTNNTKLPGDQKARKIYQNLDLELLTEQVNRHPERKYS